METKAKRLTLDLDPIVQKRLKVMAALKGTSMRRYCLSAIERELAQDEASDDRALPFGEEALDRLVALRKEIFGARKVPEDSTELIRVAREERSRSQ